MGVDHGGQVPPRIWSRGDAKANSPPQISSYRYKNERSVAFKPGLCPGPRWGSSRRFPRPLVGWRGDTPPHTPPQSAPTHLWCSPCVPPKVQPDLRLWLHVCVEWDVEPYQLDSTPVLFQWIRSRSSNLYDLLLERDQYTSKTQRREIDTAKVYTAVSNQRNMNIHSSSL